MLLLPGCGGGDDTTNESPDDDEPPTTTIETRSTTSDGIDDPDGTTPTPSSATTTTDPSAPTFDSEWCAALDQDEPPPDFADLVPPEYADAIQTLIDITDSFESLESSIPSGVIDRLAAPETGSGLAGLADLAERQCGPSESVDGRWSNAADRYFVRDFRLSEQDLDFVDAFVAACESARPGWITDA